MIEFLYPGDSDVYEEDTCWTTECTKRTSKLDRQCQVYSSHCKSIRPKNCGLYGSYFDQPRGETDEVQTGCRYTCCKNVYGNCRVEMAYADYGSYGSFEDCVNDKSNGECNVPDMEIIRHSGGY